MIVNEDLTTRALLTKIKSVRTFALAVSIVVNVTLPSVHISLPSHSVVNDCKTTTENLEKQKKWRVATGIPEETHQKTQQS